MLRTYCVNIAGPSHLECGIPCQDACAVAHVGERLMVAAVADGLGSEVHSDIGSRVACEVSVKWCAEAMATPDASGDVIAVIREAFARAYDAVLDEAERLGLPAGQFDSTLCLSVFDGETAWWGNAGDSGLVVALVDGTYVLVTRMQRDDEGRVYPLCFDERWEFGQTEGAASLMLSTDGVLEGLVAPPVLAAHADNPVDTRMTRMFLHPEPDDAEHLAEVEAQAAHYLSAYPRELLDDDKTIVVAFDDESLPGEQPAGYYDGPNWEAITARAQAGLYPDPDKPEEARP